MDLILSKSFQQVCCQKTASINMDAIQEMQPLGEIEGEITKVEWLPSLLYHNR